MFKKILITLLLFISFTWFVSAVDRDLEQEDHDSMGFDNNDVNALQERAEQQWEESEKQDAKAEINIANPWLERIWKWDESVMNALLWITSENIIKADDEWWLTVLGKIAVWIKDTLTSLVILIAVWAFLFIWIRLTLARWDPEEFKKGMMQLVYAIIWIFLISIAWATVVLVSGLNI